MNKITKKEVNQNFKDLKDLLEAAKVFSDVSFTHSDLVKAQFVLDMLSEKAKDVSSLIRRYEVQETLKWAN